MAKNNQKFWRVARIIIYVGVLIVGIAIAYGRLSKGVEVQVVQIKANVEGIKQNREDVIRLQSDVTHIKGAVDRIEEKL